VYSKQALAQRNILTQSLRLTAPRNPATVDDGGMVGDR
jgi:hypothetical protein